MPDVKDLFSDHAKEYAKYRPLYPQELFDFILHFVTEKNKALDCGTGNGQAAAILAQFFKRTDAIDISGKQIENAVVKPNLYYHICPAEKTPFENDTFDLITCATALHWFKMTDYFSEMKRIGKNNSVFACWAYRVLKTENKDINHLINYFYENIIHEYWDAERRFVDEKYSTLPFPFEEIKNPGFVTTVNWDIGTLKGYLGTWSAVQRYIKLQKKDPVLPLINEIGKLLNEKTKISISFPIFMRIGFIRK